MLLNNGTVSIMDTLKQMALDLVTLLVHTGQQFWLALLENGQQHSPEIIKTAKKHITQITKDLRDDESRASHDGTPSEVSGDLHTSLTPDADFWWKNTSRMLSILLRTAEYSPRRQQAAMSLYHNTVVENLGPRPKSDRANLWRSFMTDDHTPVEFSWKWAASSEQARPEIRFSFEVIGNHAGSALDPWNSEASIGLFRQLQDQLVEFDTSIIHRLTPELMRRNEEQMLLQRGSPGLTPDQRSVSSYSSMFVAMELTETEPTIKAYMLPQRSTVGAKSSSELIQELLLSFAQEQSWVSLVNLLSNMNQLKADLHISPFMISFDCVPVAASRLKIYFRSAETSLESVLLVLSRFDASFAVEPLRQEFEDLWKCLFGAACQNHNHMPLRQIDHDTAGMLYYLEVRPGSRKITPKVYLPVKHYAASDFSVLHGLTDFLQRHRPQEQHFIDNYGVALREICGAAIAQTDHLHHTYISCAAKNNGLDITSYISPNVYVKQPNK